MSVELKGRNGYAVGSKNYFRKLNEAQTLSELMKVKDSCNYYNDLFRAANSGSKRNTPEAKTYRGRMSSALEALANVIERDLKKGAQNNDYILDENVDRLKHAGEELARCGVSKGKDIVKQAKALSWFVGGNHQKILQMQKDLNKLAIKGKSGRLKEDGVYGKETLAAWNSFYNKLVDGTVPILNWVDPLQSNLTGITVGSTKSGGKAGLSNALVLDQQRYIRFDPPHPGQTGWFRENRLPINYNHINMDVIKDAKESTWIYDKIRKSYNHYPLSDDAYNILKNLKGTGKTVRVAGKTLLVAGVALDALELGIAIDKDLKDTDKKLGKKTVSTAEKIGGRWAGAAAGEQIGAFAGAFTGPAAPVFVPVLALAGGVAGSLGGDAFAGWVVDITYVGE